MSRLGLAPTLTVWMHPTTTVLAVLTVALSSLLTPGCGGDDDTSGGDTAAAPSCAARVAFTGGFQGGIEWADIGCGVPFGPDTGVEMVFLPGDGTIAQFVVSVAGVHPAETGTFEAGCGLVLSDDRRWSTATTGCSITIDANEVEKHDGTTDRYAVHGTGSCSAPAEAAAGTTAADVTVGPFEVQFPAVWPAQ